MDSKLAPRYHTRQVAVIVCLDAEGDLEKDSEGEDADVVVECLVCRVACYAEHGRALADK